MSSIQSAELTETTHQDAPSSAATDEMSVVRPSHSMMQKIRAENS